MLKSTILETERLSPLEIGVMRRGWQDTALSTTLGGDERHDVPARHDVWLYLAGANRDSTVFEDAERFHFDRCIVKIVRIGLADSALGQGQKLV